MEFSLSPEWLEARLRMGRCVKTGIEFDLTVTTEQHANPFAPSIDRLDCSEGYTEQNCRLVVWIYNVMRQDFSDEHIERFARSFAGNYPLPH